MRQLVKLIKAEILMLYGELKHYYFNYIFYNLGIVIFFIGIIKNFDFRDNVILQIVSLITWHIITSSISYLCNVIQDEAVMGTLEQLFLTKANILKIFFSKVIVNVMFTLAKSIILFCICLLVFHKNIDTKITFYFVIITLIVEILMAIGSYSFGLFLGGIALYFKRISSFVQVISNILLFFSGILITIKPNNILYYILPIPSGIDIVRLSLYGSLKIKPILIFMVITMVYIIVSIIVSNKLMKKTKKDGVLGNY